MRFVKLISINFRSCQNDSMRGCSLLCERKKGTDPKINWNLETYICYLSMKVSEPTPLRSGNRVILGKNHVFRYHHPEQAVKQKEASETVTSDNNGNTEKNDGQADWEFAQSELLESEGVDLKLEMESKMKEMEEVWKKEREEVTQAFHKERQKYEDQIDTLQKQVMEQSMTMSMMSSVTPDDFNHGDDDLYGESDISQYNAPNHLITDIF